MNANFFKECMALNSGDTAWMLVSTGLVMIMVPALGFFEAGLI
jgi:Amt family ammonium transporter